MDLFLYLNLLLCFTGCPCDSNGNFLLPGVPPSNLCSGDNWGPFRDRLKFELADFLYSQNQMPAQQINTLQDIWAESLCNAWGQPLYANHRDLYKTIDAIEHSDVKWNCFSIKYTGMQDNNGLVP
ncbi:hypothetical protein L210DRAFT_846029 [Boletus edulis BED1]|uniref:Uncharacterized protein n=1 Tax=Boletus edulis BED1 TaxID=1328754 RepID=A0AAD4BVE4_BOLED|nr:hypothetical protein L210DRAFT_846029 [Boletus edulis BED1]